SFLVPRSQAARPFAIDRERAITCGVDDAVQRGRTAREDLHVAAAVVAKLRGDVRDTNEASLAEDAPRSINELEMETPPTGEHHVSFTHHGTAHCRDHRRMFVRHEAAALAGVKIWRAQPVEQPHERPCRAAGSAS